MRDRDFNIDRNHFVANVRALLNELLDLDPRTEGEQIEADLTGMVGLCGEFLLKAQRISEQEKEERMTEPPDSGWVAEFNRSQGGA